MIRPSRSGVRTPLRRRLGGQDADRGASSIELVMYTPILMFVIFLTVQFALSWHGSEVAGAVARETARVARAGGGGAQAIDDARARGTEYAAAIGGSALTDVAIQITPLPADQSVRVTVTGRSVEIIGGLAPRVSRSVQGPVEVFRPDL